MKSQPKAQAELDDQGRRVITKNFLKQICIEKELFTTPHLNEILYLHFYGLYKISNLNDYINLHTLHLENNCISSIEGLDKLVNLRFLFLQNNKIKTIENLQNQKKLVSLNLSQNLITEIGNIESLISLETLNLSGNYFETAS